MSTKAGTMGFSARPALFTFWTVAVSVLAAAALVLSAVALNVAGRGDRSVTSVEGSGTREAAGQAEAYLAGQVDQEALERGRAADAARWAAQAEAYLAMQEAKQKDSGHNP